jgi:hypothetical protein
MEKPGCNDKRLKIAYYGKEGKEQGVMPRMTNEEADALAEQAFKNPPKVSGDGKSGFFMKQLAMSNGRSEQVSNARSIIISKRY